MMTDIKVKLISDFTEHYDHWFDQDGELFYRLTTDGPSRNDMFSVFKKLNISTPLHGQVNQLPLEDHAQVVVYTEPRKHRGEGKQLLTLGEAKKTHKHYFASEYINSSTDYSRSTRHLWINDRGFLLRYKSTDDWRSNCGNCRVTS